MSKNNLINKNMATFNYEEAIYGALCFIAGNDDNKISIEEKEGIKPRFLELHYLSDATMETISKKWSKDVSGFYYDVIDSLNECSYTEKLEAYKTICIILNAWTKRTSRWEPALDILNAMNISKDEYNRYIGK